MAPRADSGMIEGVVKEDFSANISLNPVIIYIYIFIQHFNEVLGCKAPFSCKSTQMANQDLYLNEIGTQPCDMKFDCSLGSDEVQHQAGSILVGMGES